MSACRTTCQPYLTSVRLQDNVPAFDSAEAISIIERNLGAPVTQMYESFDSEPIAAASLGQVGPGPAVPDHSCCSHHLCSFQA